MAGVRGRGNAVSVILLGVMLFLILLPSDAAVYKVGGMNGWSFNSALWTRPKTFRVGDQIGKKFCPSLSFHIFLHGFLVK